MSTPRTAAYIAGQIANERVARLGADFAADWREAAAREGALYSEAIRGGRLYRIFSNDPRYYVGIDSWTRDYARAVR